MNRLEGKIRMCLFLYIEIFLNNSLNFPCFNIQCFFLGMALYSLSCSIYSTAIEKLVKRFRAKPVYIGGQLVYSIGMIFMAISRSTWGVILFSWSAGIMYSTLFTMPYLIVAHYHETDCVSIKFVNMSFFYIKTSHIVIL